MNEIFLDTEARNYCTYYCLECTIFSFRIPYTAFLRFISTYWICISGGAKCQGKASCKLEVCPVRGTVPYSTVQYSTVLCCGAQCSAVQYR